MNILNNAIQYIGVCLGQKILFDGKNNNTRFFLSVQLVLSFSTVWFLENCKYNSPYIWKKRIGILK